MKTTLAAYCDRKFRQCPSFAIWHRATQEFIAHNNADKTIAEQLQLRFAMRSKVISAEFASRAYQAGPVGKLP